MSPSRAAANKQHQIELLVGALHGYVRGYKAWLHDALRREKLTLPQLRLLHAIEDGEGESAASIARSLMVTPQTLQTMLERAVRERWIVRTHAVGNQRVLTATLTPRGLALLGHGKALSAQFDRLIWSGIGMEALQQCADTLSRGVANMESLRAAEASPTAAATFKAKAAIPITKAAAALKPTPSPRRRHTGNATRPGR